ncbi:MAG TPA: hypothetical protein VJ960_02160, partial [Oceanipulchritudo sp.]|nr:hypothetical protein [Oceanipulchritudo sp.]
MNSPFLRLLPFLLFPLLPAKASSDFGQRHEAYLDRARLLLQEVVDRIDPTDLEKGGRGQILASLALDTHLDWASERLLRDLEEPRGDMFWMIP